MNYNVYYLRFKKFFPYLLFAISYLALNYYSLGSTLLCMPRNLASNLSDLFTYKISIVTIIAMGILSHYKPKIKEKQLLLTILIILLMAVSIFVKVKYADCLPLG